MDNRSEASQLRIVTRAELEQPFGSRPKTGRGSSSVGFNSRVAHVWYPPVHRGTLTPSVQLAKSGEPDPLSGAAQGVSPWSRPRASTGDGIGLRPAPVQGTKHPIAPLTITEDLDKLGVLKGVTTFNFHLHLAPCADDR
jgi:hypothetical protein